MSSWRHTTGEKEHQSWKANCFTLVQAPFLLMRLAVLGKDGLILEPSAGHAHPFHCATRQYFSLVMPWWTYSVDQKDEGTVSLLLSSSSLLLCLIHPPLFHKLAPSLPFTLYFSFFLCPPLSPTLLPPSLNQELWPEPMFSSWFFIYNYYLAHGAFHHL